MIIIDILLI